MENTSCIEYDRGRPDARRICVCYLGSHGHSAARHLYPVAGTNLLQRTYIAQPHITESTSRNNFRNALDYAIIATLCAPTQNW